MKKITPYKRYSELSEIERKNILTHYNFGRKYGLTQRDVCKEFNISRYALQKVFDNSPDDKPVYSKRINPFDLNQIVDQYKAGMAVNDPKDWRNSIAGYHGLKESTIIKYLRECGVYKNGNKEKSKTEIIPEVIKSYNKERENSGTHFPYVENTKKDLEKKIEYPASQNTNVISKNDKGNYFRNFKNKIIKSGVGALLGVGLFLGGLGVGLGTSGCEKKGYDNKKIEQTYIQSSDEQVERQGGVKEIRVGDYNYSVVNFCNENKIPTEPLVRGKIYEELGLGKYKYGNNAKENEKLLKTLIELRQKNPEEFANVVRGASKFYTAKNSEISSNLESKLKEYGLTKDDIFKIYKNEYGGNFCGSLEQTQKFLNVVDKYKPQPIETPKLIEFVVEPAPIVEETQLETNVVPFVKTYTQVDLEKMLKVRCDKIKPDKHSFGYELLDETIFFNIPEMIEVSDKILTAKYSQLKEIAVAGTEIFGDKKVVGVYLENGVEFYRMPKDINGNSEMTDVWRTNVDFNGRRTPKKFIIYNDPKTKNVTPEKPDRLITFSEFGEQISSAEENKYPITPQHLVNNKKYASGFAIKTKQRVKDGIADLGPLELKVQNGVYCQDKALNWAMLKSASKVIGVVIGGASIGGGGGDGAACVIRGGGGH